ncbi:MAG: histidine phosphatase family protein [Gaiellales bacterium]
MTRLVLVRHGETDWNREGRWQGHADPGLNDRGREQAAAAARRLAGQPVSALVTSDLHRAVETAAAVAGALGMQPTLDPRLREVDVGDWSGLTRDQVRAQDPQGYQAWLDGENAGYPGGETFAQLQARTAAAMDDLWRRHADSTVVVVCHGGTIRAMVATALGLGAAGRRLLATGPNGSLSVLESRYGGGVGLVSFNDGGHVLPASIV